MKRDAIDFERDGFLTLFRKLLIPTLLGTISMSAVTAIDGIFVGYGVGAFGIACYYTPFSFMLGNAVAQSAQPIISYNYGVSRWREIAETCKLLFSTSVAIGVVVALLFVLIPDVLVVLFVDASSVAGRIAIEGFPYFATGIVFFILNVAIVGYYQSVEQIRRATIFVFLRGFALLVPCFILLPKFFGTEGIWLAMPLAELMTTAIIAMMYFKQYFKDYYLS